MIGEIGGRRAAWIGIGAGLWGLVACGQPAEGPRLICPNCIALDSYAAAFGGISPNCSPPLTPASVPDAVAQQVDLAGVLDLARGAFESDLRWELGPNPAPSAPAPRGYGMHPRARGTIAFGEPLYYAGPPGAAASFGCWATVKVPAVVSVTTDDGAIAAETNGALTLVVGDFPGRWMLETYADLTGLTGSLDLRLDPRKPQRGYLLVAMIPSLSPSDGPRGVIQPHVWTFPTVADALAYDPGSHGIYNGEESYPIGGRWPDDECAFDHVPIETGAPQVWLGGDSLAGRLEAAREAIGAGQPHPARWSSGAAASVTVDIDTPARACVQDFAGIFLDFAIDAPGRISTSDGRVATVVPRADFVVGLGPNASNSLDLTRVIEQTAPPSFETQAGIRAIDAAGSPWLNGYIGVSYRWSPDGQVTELGAVEVGALPDCHAPGVTCGPDYIPAYGSDVACLYWPPPSEFPEICDRHRR